jgi:hypothetical protein
MLTTKKLMAISLMDIARELKNAELFVSEMEEWVGEDEIIFYENRMETHSNIIIITGDGSHYSLFRCFPIGGAWNCSCDVQEKELQEIFSRIFKLA